MSTDHLQPQPPPAHEDGIDLRRLANYLAAVIPGFTPPVTIRRFQQGQSNPTYLLQTAHGRYVLRRKPSGSLLPSAHAVDREYRVMAALGTAGFPVPHVYSYAEDSSIVETPFYVMAYVEGRIFWDARLPGQTAEARTAIYDSINATLAALHTLDYAALGLGDYGKAGNYFARQIARWAKQYQASQTETIPEMDRLAAWLPDNVPDPEDQTTCIVHGDFGIYNLMFHPTAPRLLAVLDWEISTLGHPIADLVYAMMPYYSPIVVGGGTLIDQDLKALGIPSADEFIQRYCERSGYPAIENIAYYRAYNLFRSAAIAQGIVGRVVTGNAANPRAQEIAAYVRPLAAAAYREAQSAGMS